MPTSYFYWIGRNIPAIPLLPKAVGTLVQPVDDICMGIKCRKYLLFLKKMSTIGIYIKIKNVFSLPARDFMLQSRKFRHGSSPKYLESSPDESEIFPFKLSWATIWSTDMLTRVGPRHFFFLLESELLYRLGSSQFESTRGLDPCLVGIGAHVFKKSLPSHHQTLKFRKS